LVLVNGKRLGSATLGKVQFQHIPANIIDRIEIVSNARSSIFGADALGGVINIVTKQGAIKTNNVRAAIGNQNTSQLSTKISQTVNDLTIGVSAFTEKTKGYDVNRNNDNDRDGSERHSADIVAEYKINSNNTISAQIQQNRGTVDYDGAAGKYAKQGLKNDFKQQVLGLDWNLQNGAFSSTLSFGKSSDRSWNYGAGTPRFKADAFVTERDSAEFTSLYAINKHHDLMFVADYRKEDISKSDKDYDKTESTTTGAGLSHRYSSEKLFTEAGVRYDDAQRYDAQTSYSASVGYALVSGLELTLARNTGFRAPSFNDLYFPESAYSAGNPDLKPEKSENNRFAINYEYSEGSVEISYQESDVKNLIQWTKGSTGKWTPSNVNKAELKSAQLNWNGKITEQLSSTFGFEWLEAKDKKTGDLLARRSPRVFKAGVTYTEGKLSTSLNGRHVAEHYDNSGNTDKIAAYALYSAAATWTFNESFSSGLRINNLTNKTYESAKDYRGQGRVVLLSGQYNF